MFLVLSYGWVDRYQPYFRTQGNIFGSDASKEMMSLTRKQDVRGLLEMARADLDYLDAVLAYR